MKTHRYFVAALLVGFFAGLSSARATQVVTSPTPDPYTLTVNGSSFGGGVLTFNPSSNQWSTDPIGGFNNTALPDGTFFDSNNALNIDLLLTTSITLGDNINYGFGLAGIDPAVDEGGFLFNFSISLINDGTPITDPFGFTAINPFGFSVDNIGTGTSATITGGTFNEIDVVVTGPLDPTVTNFGVGVGNQVTTVPDTAMTAALVALGLVAIVAFGRRGSLLTRRS